MKRLYSIVAALLLFAVRPSMLKVKQVPYFCLYLPVLVPAVWEKHKWLLPTMLTQAIGIRPGLHSWPDRNCIYACELAPELSRWPVLRILAFRKTFPTLGTLGGHLIYLNLGEQVRMDEYAQYQENSLPIWRRQLCLTVPSFRPNPPLGWTPKFPTSI